MHNRHRKGVGAGHISRDYGIYYYNEANSYHVLHPSPAGKLSPTRNTFPLNLHTPTLNLVDTAILQTLPQPLEQHFCPAGQLSSPEHRLTQIPNLPGRRVGQTRV